jgi:hypothetical protein
MNRLNDLVNTTIDIREVRSGIPRWVVFRAEVQGNSLVYVPRSRVRTSMISTLGDDCSVGGGISVSAPLVFDPSAY